MRRTRPAQSASSAVHPACPVALAVPRLLCRRRMLIEGSRPTPQHAPVKLRVERRLACVSCLLLPRPPLSWQRTKYMQCKCNSHVRAGWYHTTKLLTLSYTWPRAMKAFEIITGAGETLRVNLPGKMQACIIYLERVVGETIGHKVTE